MPISLYADHYTQESKLSLIIANRGRIERQSYKLLLNVQDDFLELNDVWVRVESSQCLDLSKTVHLLQAAHTYINIIILYALHHKCITNHGVKYKIKGANKLKVAAIHLAN